MASDLLSQAEHGVDSQVILVSPSQSVIDNILLEIDKQVEQLPRAAVAKRALENSRAFIVKDGREAMRLLNEYRYEPRDLVRLIIISIHVAILMMH